MVLKPEEHSETLCSAVADPKSNVDWAASAMHMAERHSLVGDMIEARTVATDKVGVRVVGRIVVLAAVGRDTGTQRPGQYVGV